MRYESDVTGLVYEAEDCVFFRNYVQAAYYNAWGATLIDLFTDSNMKWVFVFSKEDHRKYIDKWMENKKMKECE